MSESKPFLLHLESFEGPLDLLLHLIEESQVDLAHLPIAQLTAQYLDYLHSVEVWELEKMGEYLVMAATLLEIKSQSLLPQFSSGTPEEEWLEEEEDGEDLQEMLVARLREYRRFKRIAEHLKWLEEQRLQIFSRSPEDLGACQAAEPQWYNLSLLELMIAYHDMMVEVHRRTQPRLVKIGEVSVQEMKFLLEEELRQQRRTSFFQLLQPGFFTAYPGGTRKGRPVIPVFLALLDLVREGRLRVWQEEFYSDIQVEWVGEA